MSSRARDLLPPLDEIHRRLIENAQDRDLLTRLEKLAVREKRRSTESSRNRSSQEREMDGTDE
jgi:hypothetical protein